MRISVIVAMAIVAALEAQPTCKTALIGDSIFSQLGSIAGTCNVARSGAPMSEIAVMPVPASVRTVIVEGGINDVLNGESDDAIVAHYRSAIVVHKGRRVRVVGVLPVDPDKMRDGFAQYATKERVSRLNERLSALCERYTHCAMATWDFDPRHTVDGIHWSDDARAEMRSHTRR